MKKSEICHINARTSILVNCSFSVCCSFSFRLQKENEPKEMRFAAVQILAKIGVRSLNGEKLDELHYISLIFGQFAVLHALSPPISSRHNLQGGGG
ncbi:MAG: hypothetical protein J6X65_05520 [Bacteroidales bacterium]|nr:hypothetical protein [Bacteroidales bacterium]